MDQASSDVQIEVSFKRRLVYWTAFILVSLLITFVVAELFVRFFTKPIYPILNSDERVGTIHKQNIHEYLWDPESESEVFTMTNSLGYMGHREPSDPKGDAMRIALIGDSYTESLQVDYYESFPYLLESALNVGAGTSSPKVEVYNYGVGGTGTFLQLLRYREHIRPYDMDVVGLIFSVNDFEDNMNKIHFDIDAYEGAEGRNLGLKHFILQFALPKFIFKQLMGEVWFLKFLSALGLYELNEYTLEKTEHGGGSIMDEPQYFTFTFDLIRKMKAEVEAQGSIFFVSLRTYNLETKGESGMRAYYEAKKFLDEEKIRYVETGIDFEDPYGKGKECLTYRCLGHFNPRGHIVFAQILYEPLRDMLCEQNSLACKAP